MSTLPPLPIDVSSVFPSRGDRCSSFRRSLLLAAGLFAALAGCERESTTGQNANANADPAKLNVVVTTSMVGDLVRSVAGDHAHVTGLMGEGVDPHLYRPTSRDLGLMMKADVIFYSGLGLEGAMQSAFERVKKSGKTVAAVTSGLPGDQLIHSANFAGHPDPHVWNDAALWAECLDEVVQVLSRADAAHAEEFASNAAKYRALLEKLDQYARDCIGSIPAESRYLITAHDAFGYFARAYQIEEKSVQGISTESEPGVQDINDLVDFLVKHRVPALFVEATVNSANLRAVIEGAQQRGWIVKEGGTLFSDSTGAPGTYEGSYVGMFDHNVTTITRALNGEAPARGMEGRLTVGKGSAQSP
ncbi:metal ABC transporter solute-binding protein, Zn/Mn family [Planctomicrobium sp. SH661]|uniref:metal ABC transporter solute-binding protein, Zn/Mn family n=1 Tax=Planctomicrobium sp. SH661 TaxID=3448124 RepID=UPI003F5C6968